METEPMYYKGYAAHSEYSEEDRIFCGTILGILQGVSPESCASWLH